VEALRPRPGGGFLDATVGFGGHAADILARSSPDGRLWGIDRDPEALSVAESRLAVFGVRVRLARGNYDRAGELFPDVPGGTWDGILADLGVSSLQLLTPERGFSFQREGPLDMRMDPAQPETAASYVERVNVEELEERLVEAGETRFAGKLARLLKSRLFSSTLDLAAAVARTVPRRGRTHPATRVFMALRLAVNGEMESLKRFLTNAPAWLGPGGRLAVITFHSLEDRVVKRFYKETPGFSSMKSVTKSPLIPTWEERKRNPRSRSAKLRVFEKR